MNVLHRSLVERRAGRDHVAAVERAASEPLPPDSVAAAIYYQGAIRLWAGHSPGILRKLVREGGFRPSPAWLRMLGWAAWGRVSPATLRLFLRVLVRARDVAAGTWLEDGGPYEWRLT
jgi:hypothetical protein